MTSSSRNSRGSIARFTALRTTIAAGITAICGVVGTYLWRAVE